MPGRGNRDPERMSNHALIDGNKRSARLAMRVFLRFNGVSVSTVPPPFFRGRPVAECGGTSSPCTRLCLLRIVDLAMGDYDCQRVAVAVRGVVDLYRQAATRLAYCVAGWLAPGGKSLPAATGGAGVPLAGPCSWLASAGRTR